MAGDNGLDGFSNISAYYSNQFAKTSENTGFLSNSNSSQLFDTINNNSLLQQQQKQQQSSTGVTSLQVLLASFLVALEFLTIFGNVLVLLAITLDFRLRSPSHFLMGSLAIADLLLSILVLPFHSLELYYNKWFFGEIFCEIFITCDVLCCTASIYLVTVISIDRYISITRPLRYESIMTQTRVYLLISFAWFLSIIVSMVRLIWFKPGKNFKKNLATDAHNICEMSEDFKYLLGSAALSYYIPLVVILFVYYKIFRLARHHMKFIKNNKVNSNNAIVGANRNGKSRQIEYNDTANIRLIEYKNDLVDNFCCCNLNGTNAKHADKKKSDASSVSCNSTKPIIENSSGAQTMILSNTNNTNNTSSKDICENCRKSISLSSKVIQLKNNGILVTTTTTKTNDLTTRITTSKTKKGLSKTARFLNFLRRFTKFKTEQKAAKTLGIVVGCLILCWAPFFILSPLDGFCPQCNIPKYVFQVCIWLGYCNSAMNPLIYCLSSQEFRKAYKSILRCNLQSIRN